MTILLTAGLVRRCLATNNAVGWPLGIFLSSEIRRTYLVHRKAFAKGSINGKIRLSARAFSGGFVDISDRSDSRHSHNSDDIRLQRWLETAVTGLAPDDAGKFVLEFWNEVEEKNASKSCRFYPLIFRALCTGGYLVEAFKLLNSLVENAHIISVLPLCNFYLRCCVKMRSFTDAYLCLEFMDRWLVGKNEVTYCELLELAVLQKNIGAVHDIWQEYMKKYSLNILSLRKYLWSLVRLNELQAAYEVLQGVVTLAFQDMDMKTTAWRKALPSKLDIPVPTSAASNLVVHNIEKSMEKCTLLVGFDISRVPDMKSKEAVVSQTQPLDNYIFMHILRRSFDDVIRACMRNQNCALAEELFLQMQSLGVNASSHTFDGLIRVVIPERGFHAGMELLKVMQLSNLRPSDSTLESLAIGCCKALELDFADTIMDQISKTHIRLYNVYLAACDKLDQPERAVQLLGKMKRLRLQPNIRTYELLFSLFGNVNPPYENGDMSSQAESTKRINAIEMDMVKNGVGHSCVSVNNLLKARGDEGMIDEMMWYFHMAEKQFSHSNTLVEPTLYNTVLHSLVETENSHIAADVFTKMRLRGVHPNAATYTIMIDCCNIMDCFKAALALVSLMVRDGYNPNAETYTVLIKILLKNGDFDQSCELMRHAFYEGIFLDVVLFNTILREACEKRRIDVVETVLAQMHQHRIKLDSSTCANVFSAYTDCGYFNTALEALQVLSVLILSEGEEGISEYKHLILSEDADTELAILELYGQYKADVACALLSIRWCATLGSSINWSPNESPWLQRLLEGRH